MKSFCQNRIYFYSKMNYPCQEYFKYIKIHINSILKNKKVEINQVQIKDDLFFIDVFLPSSMSIFTFSRILKGGLSKKFRHDFSKGPHEKALFKNGYCSFTVGNFGRHEQNVLMAFFDL